MQNLKLVENVKMLAAKKNVTAGQMALAWLQHQVTTGSSVCQSACCMQALSVPGCMRKSHLLCALSLNKVCILI